jgi:hypothetical protein
MIDSWWEKILGNATMHDETFYRNKFNSSWQVENVRTLLFDKELTTDGKC